MCLGHKNKKLNKYIFTSTTENCLENSPYVSNK